MDVNDLKGLNAEVKKRMDGAIEHVRKELAGLRSGRATRVDCSTRCTSRRTAAMMPLNQVASLSVPEPTMIVAQPFDPSLLERDREGIQKSNLGLNPASDGKVLRIPIPSLTEERRKEMSRLVHKYAEDGRNAVRQVRRDANDRLKKLLKDHKISEDDERRALDDVQKITDQHVVDDRRAAEEERPGTAREVDGRPCPISRTSNAPSRAAPGRATPAQIAASLRVRRAAARALRPGRGARRWSRDSLGRREASMWRYREVMPLFDGEAPVTLGEGWTPLLHAPRLGATLGLERLFVKDESLNPTNSFKARGLSAAVTRALHLGAQVAVDSDGRQCRQRHGRLRRARGTRGARSSCRAT